MKQTNNAIKFLMAQYRAIFKNAYFKGITTAVALTAALSATAAQAGSYDSLDSLKTADGSDLIVNNEDTFNVSVSGDGSIVNNIIIKKNTGATFVAADGTTDLSVNGSGKKLHMGVSKN